VNAVLTRFSWIVVAPGSTANLRLAAEAARAGARGFVDLEDVRDADGFRRAKAAILSETDVALGVKLDASRAANWEPLLAARPPQLTQVLLSRPPRSAEELRGLVSGLQGLGLEVLVEAVGVDEALRAERAGADAIVAKGSEAAGRIGDETSFLLLQRLAGLLTRPFFAHGGVGLHTAAACKVAGASGAVLDWQLALVDESRLPAPLRLLISRLDGSETAPVGLRLKDAYRLYLGPGRALLARLQEQEQRLVTSDLPEDERIREWRGVVDDALAGAGDVRAMGMEVSFAARLAAQYRTVAGVLEAMDRSLRFHLSRAREAEPLGPDKGAARLLGTRYPIVQGPMSRVSDTPAFAAAVAAAGGLPVMAIAAMREDELEPMLRDTRDRLADAPWAAGLLGFLPQDQYGPQVELVRKYRPPVVVIAGGQPAQARTFEAEGIPTFIHVPSHRLLDLYLDEGTRNVIFEGLECGGHIGRYSGFVLWENVIEVLLARIPRESKGGRCGALFAGGISTALSGAMVSAIVAPLADRAVDVGVLVGTGYLFTREAVECGAINAGFQGAILAARETAILDCGGGYQIRAAPNPFCDAFEAEKQRMIAQGLPAEEVRMALEHLTLGRLRIAAKGLRFNERYRQDKTAPVTLEVPEAVQQQEGVYMAGQAILLHDSVYSLADLHRRVSEESGLLLRASDEAAEAGEDRSGEIAIVGMSGIFPGAGDLETYWANILAGKYSITEVPQDRWSLGDYFDQDPRSRDKIYSRWGGFLDPIEFDPLKYGMPPKAVGSTDPFQLLTLELVDRALRDAGYDQRWFDRENTSVFVGEAGGGNLGQLYCLRSLLPMVMRDVPEAVMSQLPEWTEDSFPGLLPNVIAGRVANQFDLGGTNLSTSAACAAGLAALSLGMDDLRAGRSRMSIVAAVDVAQNPYVYMSFSKTMALSPTGTPRCFDESGDGIVISQGVGVVILKRLLDAERDGDRIYAVLRGLGSSSDGRGKSLTAPTSKGQLRAIHRAYGQAGFDLDTVELIEAHGTGTVLGDRTEAETITSALREAGAAPKSCAVGSVKSMIGHTKGCAGIASLIKVALALHHKVLPPTIGVKKPTAPEMWAGDSPAYLNTELRPWVGRDHARRAGVSSFGFGGTNFHAALQEHGRREPAAASFPTAMLPAELFCFAGTADEVRKDVEAIRRAAEDPTAALRDLAHRAFQMGRDRGRADGALRLAVVAESVADLVRKLGQAESRLASRPDPLLDPTGIYLTPAAAAPPGKVAFLFPGQGSQRVDMLRDLALLFSELRESFALADRVLAPRLPLPLSQYVYPPGSFTEEERAARMEALTRTDVTQPALGAAGLGLHKVLRAFGVRPDMAAGHSVGEYVALCAAGVLPEESLYDVLWARGSCMLQAAGERSGTMMAIQAPRETVEDALRGETQIFLANFNAPAQTVVSGMRADLEALQARLAKGGVEARLIPVSCGFHSPFVAEAAKAFEKALEPLPYGPARFPVYSNHLAAPYPAETGEARRVLSAHLSHPVRFMDEIQRMYEDGARVFVEVGPGRVCGNLVGEILRGRPHAVVSCDGAASRVGTVRLLHALGQMFAHGLDLRLDPLFNRRRLESRAPAAGPAGKGAAARPKVTWMVSPEVSWPAGTPRPQITAVAVASPAPAPAAARPTPAVVPQAAASRTAPPLPPPPQAAAPPPAPAFPPPASSPPGDPLVEVVLRHQKLMASFLDQQKQVMLAYLGGRPAVEAVDLAAIAPTAAAPLAAIEPVAVPAPAPVLQASAPMRPEPVVQPVQEHPAPVTPAPAPVDLLAQLVALVSERTGYPAEALAPEQDMEADLGIDSIKRVEILTSFARRFPDLGEAVPQKLRAARTLQDVVQVVRENLPAVTEAAAPPAFAAPTVQVMAEVVAEAPAPKANGHGRAAAPADLLAQLVALVSERTGYPAEALSPEQDMEADLGIDSIKRVEILTSFARRFPDLGEAVPQKLRAARTLQDVVQVVRENLAVPANGTPVPVPAPPPVAHPVGEILPAAPVAKTNGAPSSPPADLLDQLVALVSERTGYPAEALSPEQDMEADLGIDSIKRVEILTSFARRFPDLGEAVPQKLRAARTLQDVVRVVRENLAVPANGAPESKAAPAGPPVLPAPSGGEGLERYILKMTERALPSGAVAPIPKGALVITDDGCGYAAALADRLRSLGGRPVIVRLAESGAPPDGYAADLADQAQVEALVERIRRDHGRIGGVLHLLPLRPVPPVHALSAEDFGRLMNEEVKGLFYLLRHASSDLRSAPGSWVLTALSFGAPPTDGVLPVPDHPWRGGLIGVIKTLTVEWPDVVAKSLVLENSPAEEALGRMLGELATPRHEREAYYRNGSRLVPEPWRAPLRTERALVDLGPGDVVVLVGGARGITAEVGREMARQARPTLILVGRSPWPEGEEPEATARAVSDGDLKRVLFEQLKARGKAPGPREIDAEARRILREREMRAARAAMEAAGSRVFYHAADIRDGASTAELFRQVYEAHGRIDGLVSGAGIIEDKLIEDKTAESFDRVFDTKARAIFHLARFLKPEALKFFVIFSSVAGWSGNRGQVDYVAANEVLNRMAVHLNARWNRRVVAIDWGPWEKSGMVTPETRRQFLERGVGLVPPDAGRRFLMDEIRFGDPSETIVAAMGSLAGAEAAAGQPAS
jgi:acyl transferase domain-containing protein/NAD(P)H-dependent flavin oxidoreductase YrpB (nitropropane dioxygenase family)/NAD(P)-dependent dehydrogenase (short-subunit alcohol dehydrogenase family)